MKVPRGLVFSSKAGPTGCVMPAIGPGGVGGCARSWRGWVVGSSYAPTTVPAAATTTGGYEHLVLTASPSRVLNSARLVNGPAWYPRARVRILGIVSVRRMPMRAVFVPPDANDGSAFGSHVVLIWTVARHTYGIGFHVLTDIPTTLRLDEELAASVRLVAPHGTPRLPPA
jgi:hypothetical protein